MCTVGDGDLHDRQVLGVRVCRVPVCMCMVRMCMDARVGMHWHDDHGVRAAIGCGSSYSIIANMFNALLITDATAASK